MTLGRQQTVSIMNLEKRFQGQQFANGYVVVNGVEMHAEHGERFQIPHPVLKRHVGVGQFVELRIDSPRFSVHEDAAENVPSICGDIGKCLAT